MKPLAKILAIALVGLLVFAMPQIATAGNCNNNAALALALAGNGHGHLNSVNVSQFNGLAALQAQAAAQALANQQALALQQQLINQAAINAALAQRRATFNINNFNRAGFSGAGFRGTSVRFNNAGLGTSVNVRGGLFGPRVSIRN